MPKYDQLLLEFGGGVINENSQSAAYKNDACVAIGIGGTGIAALKRLKKKVYQQLLPDNPGEPVPTYSHIKFIAIDADEIDPGHGKGKLSSSEMFSIRNPNIAQVLGTEGGKETVRNDARMSWMDIDNISALQGPNGAGGIRQVGRYLLISRADQLKMAIQMACTSAMQAVHAGSVTVYIFAGISGGTGSGCFIDTCYIVRQVMDENAWSGSGKIMGFFFLPDVVISKKEVATSQTAVTWNKRNGYAAMKELDYLMNLTLAEDHFYQKYGGFTIDTQEAPVDMCHLISATKADGKQQPEGFDYCINVAADYVMSYLIDVQSESDDGTDSQGITLRGHLANISMGTTTLQQTHGAPRIYHVVGASNAEIPMTQISTYLAAGFMERFSQMIGREKVKAALTKQKVNEWAGKLNLTQNGILAKINHGTTSLMLPDVNKGVLKSLGQMPRGKAPESWAIPGNNFLDTSQGKRTANCNGLKQEISSYALTSLLTGQTASVISSIFNLLHTICTDPGYGPYYAAQLVFNDGYDLGSVIDGLIETFEQLKGTQELYLYGRGNGGIADDIVQVSADFINSNPFNEKSRYNRYKQTVEDYYITNNRIKEYEDAISVMKTVKLQLSQLNQNYIVPMIEMLDNVKESFDEDINFLKLPKAEKASPYTWQILKLSDVKGSLDDAIKALTPKSIVTNFIDEIMNNYQEWITRDSDRIAAFISSFMSTTFAPQMNTSLQAYLQIKFPQATTPQQMASTIEQEIITKVFDDATAMFWCDPNFEIEKDTFQTASLSVPLSASSVCTAATQFKNNDLTRSCTVRKTGLKDRIFAMRFFSGLPFYAYNGVNYLKEEYDNNSRIAGVHLYARTGRGEDGTGDKDWLNFLPTPSPYSKDNKMTVDADKKIELYERACKLNIIGPDGSANPRWLLRVSKVVDERKYSIDDFMVEDAQGRRVLNKLAIDSERTRIKERIENGWKEENLERVIIMPNDGHKGLGEKVVRAVRMDYFLNFPNQQKIAMEELRKHDVLEEQLSQLDAIEEQYSERKDNLEEFCGMLFYGIFKSENYQGIESYTKIARIYYPYNKGDEPTEQVLTGSGQEFPYGSQYPLYQAYLSYIGLDRERMPREEMLEKYKEAKARKLKIGDNIIGRTLELQWDDTAIRNLKRNLSTVIKGEKILGFYTGLRRQISDFKDKFEYKDWIKLPDTAEENGTSSNQSGPELPPPPPMTQVYVNDGSETMTVFLEKSKNWAWSVARNQWVPLQPGMWVYLNNEWKQITLDQQGSIVL